MTRCDLCNEMHQSHLPTLRQLYEEAFPLSERRPWSDLEQLIGEQGAYHFFLLEHPKLGVVGFVTLWHFDDFYYGEHFAILPHLRNHRLGEQTLQTIQKYIVLDSQRTLTIITCKDSDSWEKVSVLA